MQSFELTCEDGHTIHGYQHLPAISCRGSVVIGSAMGVTQAFYQPLAKFLAENGFHVYTFDYRAMGESKHHSLKNYQHTIVDWAQLDASSVLEKALNETQHPDVFWLGHSLSGQVFPLISQIEKVKKVITIASGTGYWRYNAAPTRKKIWYFWHLIVPLSIRLFGYYPGKKVGMVGNLPASIMNQWRKWCLHPQYCVGVESEDIEQQFCQFSRPLTSIRLADDEMLSKRNIEDLFAMFGTTEKRILSVYPQEHGLTTVGHTGFFKHKHQSSLWTNVLLPELR